MIQAPLEIIPEHLREYITEQDPSLYTPIDHASWRYIMRVSRAYFSKNAHPLYLQGLDATGIAIERIPLVSEMDEALRKMGWRAVAINGFIPPSIFLEFQALRILAIACDMRKLENLGYTPSPDIVHEAAGHAPIVADPSYRAYLEAYGEVARNAIITKYDMDLYSAILKLSEIKEDPNSTASQVNLAQKHFEHISSQETEASEAALLTRMAWWTTEYGLVGSIDKPLIYGAGLLSSVAESFNCLKPEVKKIPFSLEASIKTSYDITKQQPQLFVAKNFDELTHALDEFANSMAYRKGGVYGLEVAKKAENTVTLVLDNGIQFSGIVSDFDKTESGEEASFLISGSKQIAFHDKANEELPWHHLGNKILVPLFEKSVASAKSEDIQRKLHGSGLHTKSGLRIQAHFKKEISVKGGLGKILVLEQVKITNSAGATVFEERQKPFPLVLAHKITSVFGGAADRKEFALRNSARTKKVNSHKTNLTTENQFLNELYKRVRDFREQGRDDVASLDIIVNELNQRFQADWLLRLELLEIYNDLKSDSVMAAQVRKSLRLLSDTQPELKDLIRRGLELIGQELVS
jgi:phenylalanine-4-hydroxylase